MHQERRVPEDELIIASSKLQDNMREQETNRLSILLCISADACLLLACWLIRFLWPLIADAVANGKRSTSQVLPAVTNDFLFRLLAFKPFLFMPARRLQLLANENSTVKG